MTRLRPAPSAVVLLLVAGAVWGGLTWHVKDLFVYRYAGRAVLDGLSPYAADDPVTGLPFTYPPVAAVLLVPFALAPAPAVAVGWTALSLGCLVAVVLLVRRRAGRATGLAGAACLAAAALLFEPVWQNLTFGQVNLVLMLVILVDLTNTHRRWSGVLLGIAAAVKLTPLVLVALLLLAGRRAVAARALASFVAAVGVGFLLLPRSSAAYWTDGRARGPARARAQPVGLRSAHPAARRDAAPAAVARGGGSGRHGGGAGRGGLVAAGRPGARDLPGRGGDARRVPGLLVAPLGVGGAGRAGAVGALAAGRGRLDRGVRAAPDAVAALGRGPGVRVVRLGAPPRKLLPPRGAAGRRVGLATICCRPRRCCRSSREPRTARVRRSARRSP